MKSKHVIVVMILVCMLVLPSCSKASDLEVKESASTEETLPNTEAKDGQIYLYGEQHGIKKILDTEFERWQKYYEHESMRHLFVEYPYYTAEFLNLWMQSDSDDILNAIYDDWEGTATHTPQIKEFYKKIKSSCPKTIFHGTDVGHQYGTTGERFLNYLKENNLEEAEQYKLAEKAIEQGKYFYDNSDHAYRENMMVQNFIYEFDQLKGESIMGIYGGAHTGFDMMDYSTQSVPNMATQLKKIYGDKIHSEDISWLKDDMKPYREDTIQMSGKEYRALYFGSQDLTGFQDYAFREYWRLEEAYEDVKDRIKIDNMLPYSNYPMPIEKGQILVIDYTKTDGSVKREYYRADGNQWNGSPITEEFVP